MEVGAACDAPGQFHVALLVHAGYGDGSGAGLLEPFPTAKLAETLLENPGKGDEKMSVVAGVGLHLPGKGTARPIGFLGAFDQFDAEILLYEGGERELRVPSEAGADHGIENRVGLREARAAHETQVVIGAVENKDLGSEKLEERLEIEAGQGIDQDVPFIK